MFDLRWIFSCFSHQQSANYSRIERQRAKAGLLGHQRITALAALSANAIINTVTTVLSLLVFNLTDTHTHTHRRGAGEVTGRFGEVERKRDSDRYSPPRALLPSPRRRLGWTKRDSYSIFPKLNLICGRLPRHRQCCVGTPQPSPARQHHHASPGTRTNISQGKMSTQDQRGSLTSGKNDLS